jgi:hypothetical protein
MERLELAISGVEQALRPTPPQAPLPAQAATTRRPAGATDATGQPPAWLRVVRQQLPRVMEALRAEQTDPGNPDFTARGRRLARERNRLVRQLRQLTPALSDGCLADDTDPEELRRLLLRLLHDIAHHHQRVNDLVYDGAWRDVGGSE